MHNLSCSNRTVVFNKAQEMIRSETPALCLYSEFKLIHHDLVDLQCIDFGLTCVPAHLTSPCLNCLRWELSRKTDAKPFSNIVALH